MSKVTTRGVFAEWWLAHAEKSIAGKREPQRDGIFVQNFET